ncbi:MAG TPA: ABC transporter substrate-binding protein [Solirubrobacteraceae bacterium]|jgi:branched-chain amino acid transport system substrate-binding protein
MADQQWCRSRGLGRRALVAAASVVVLAVAGCGSSKGGGSSSASSSAAQTKASKGPAAGSSTSPNAIRIGVLATCGGPFALFESEAFSGAKYALINDAGGKATGTSAQAGVSGAKIAGRPVSLFFGCSDATPDVAVAEARRLVESQKVNVLVGPLSGDEGIAVANYAKTQPQVTFVNGTSGAQGTTLSVRAPNFFRFGGDGAQWMAGLGAYAYKTLGWRKAAILGEDYSYPYTQAAGFLAEFCGLGGQVTKRVWAPLTTTDWSSYVAQLPRDVDGVLLLTGGTNTVNALKSYLGLGEQIKGHVLGGSSVLDPTAFTVGDQLAGLTGGSPVPLGGTGAQWTTYVSGFSKVYDKSLAQSLFTVLYYDAMKAVIQGVTQVKGKLSGNEQALKAALAKLTPTFPNGQVKLDANRNSVQPAYVVQVANNGGLGFKVLRTVNSVNQDFGGVFKPGQPAPSRTAPACTKGPLPSWASGA